MSSLHEIVVISGDLNSRLSVGGSGTVGHYQTLCSIDNGELSTLAEKDELFLSMNRPECPHPLAVYGFSEGEFWTFKPTYKYSSSAKDSSSHPIAAISSCLPHWLRQLVSQTRQVNSHLTPLLRTLERSLAHETISSHSMTILAQMIGMPTKRR